MIYNYVLISYFVQKKLLHKPEDSMKRTTISLSVLLLVFLLSACGGSKDLAKTDTGDIPEWYLTTPTATDYIYASASSTSRDMDLAITKASTEARAKIARTMEVKINSMQKKFEEEIGKGENSEFLSQFTQATKTIVSTELSGSQITQKKLVKDGSNWRAYVLAKYPIGAAQKAFLNKISSENNLYTRFRSTEAFAELEKDVYKYENPNQIQQEPVVAAAVTVPAIIDIDEKEDPPADLEILPVDQGVSSNNQIVNLNDFSFELINCKMENRVVTCFLIIKNNSENDLVLRVGINNTKIFDESGSEFTANKIKLANSTSKKGWTRIEKQIVPGVPTPAEFFFEQVSSETDSISLLSIFVLDGNHEVKFRDVTIEK